MATLTTKKLSIKWVRRNSKLAKNPLKTIGFGLPAGKTCPKAGSCLGPCYAQKAFYAMRPAMEARAHNLKCTIELDFAANALEDLFNMPDVEAIRIHDSGDFYSQRYLDAWIEIAEAMPYKIFYAYTKSLHLDFSQLPDNFRIIQSVGGKLDHVIDYSRPHARIFPDLESLEAAGYTNGSETDEAAYSGEVVKIGLILH